MKTVFADSFYFFALANDKDPAHERAKSFLMSYRGRLWTTEWILVELGDGLAHPLNRPSFLAIEKSLRAESHVTLLPASDDWLRAGTDLYRSRPDKSWSLTDCITFAVMQREGIAVALTGDRHFEQAGFVALLK